MVNQMETNLVHIRSYLQNKFDRRPQRATYSSLRLNHDVDDIRSVLQELRMLFKFSKKSCRLPSFVRVGCLYDRFYDIGY
jgi:hypothetical protein